MTDNEIIKALAICGNLVDSRCKECAFHETYNASCVVMLMQKALDLINRQMAEIEDWKNKYMDLWGEPNSDIHKVKKEAIKAFAERVKREKAYSFERHEKVVPVAVIDWTLKDMTEQGEDDGK